MARALNILFIKKEEENIREVFALIYYNVDSGDQSKKHGFIFYKIQNTKFEVMEAILYDEIEDEVL